MRINLVHDAIYPYSRGGGEKRFYELGKRMAEAGHEVNWIGYNYWGDEKETLISDNFNAIGVMPSGGVYNRDGKRNLMQSIFFTQAIRDEVLPEADVWDVNNIPYLHLGHIYNKKKKAKMLVTWHEYYGLAHWLRERKLSGVGAFIVERQAIKAGDEIIAVSDHTKERLVGAGTKKERISVVNNGIDFASIINTTPDIEPYDIIFGGRHVWYKGIDLLLRAVSWANVIGSTDLKVCITGDGAKREDYQRLADKLDIDAHFTGWLTDERLYAKMKSSRLFVHPSRNEGFGFVAVEAMASGLPVLTTNSPNNAVKHLINPSNGFVVDRNWRVLAPYMLEGLAKSKQMKEDCVTFASKFDWDTSIKRLNEVYQQ